MRTNAKKASQPAKLKKRRAKTTAKRSKQSLLQSAPADTPPAVVVTESGAPRWLIGLAILATIAAILSLIASSSSFRSRAEIQPVAAAVAATDQTRPEIQPRAEASPVASAPLTDADADVRHDYMLAIATGTTDAIDIFLARHPDGFHADLARVHRRKFAEFELPAVIKQLNAELKRVGCGPAGNAEWTNASQQALASFNRHTQAKFDVKSPNADVLKAVKDRTDRVCPQPQPAKAAEAVPQKQTRGLFFWQ